LILTVHEVDGILDGKRIEPHRFGQTLFGEEVGAIVHRLRF